LLFWVGGSVWSRPPVVRGGGGGGRPPPSCEQNYGNPIWHRLELNADLQNAKWPFGLLV
jgi:hypothetical protein